MTPPTVSDRLADLFAAPPPGRVYSYARFSTPEQEKGDSFRRQTEAAERWAARRGLQLDTSLAILDRGVSAFRGANTTDGGLSRFLQACERGLIEPGSFLLVESLDRISRMSPIYAQQVFTSIVLKDVTIVTLNDDQEYSKERMTSDPMALMIALMVSWRAHEESLTKARRVAAAWREKRRKVTAGEIKRLTSRGPSWLVAEGEGWSEDTAKVATVRRIFALTLSGFGEHRIAKTLNEEGVPVLGRGKQWHRSSVAKMLRNSAVIGILTPGHMDFSGGRKVRCLEEPVPNAFPAIISEADWLAVRAMKDGSTAAVRGRHASSGVAHMLAGLAKCAACGAAMVRVNKGSTGKGGKPKLVCAKAKVGAGCAYVSISVDETDGAVARDWGALFADVPAGSDNGHLDNAHADLEASIAGTEDLLEDLSEALARSPSTVTAHRISRVEAELRLMRKELEELDERRRLVDRGLIRSRLEDLGDLFSAASETGQPLDITRTNAALKVLFSEIVVDHPRGLLRFRWRQGGETSIRYAWRDAA